MCVLLSDFLRKSLRLGERTTVKLSEELDLAKNYLAIEQIRFGERLQIEWEVDVSIEGVEVPTLLLQPLVENAIKHAFNPRSLPGTLVISARVVAGELQLVVRDDGPGATAQPAAAGHGLGLATVARRLALLHGERGTLAVQTAPGAGFEVRVQLPAFDGTGSL
jgi:sensor histidine kinase YesM